VVKGDDSSEGPRGLRNTFRSLRYRNYRLFFAGQGASLLGTWVQRLALPWLVWRLTGSPFLLGLVAFAGWIPAIILSPIAGALIDRWDRYSVLVVTQVLSMVQAIVLTVLYFLGETPIWVIIGLSLFLGCINAFDVPARQSFVVDMVDDRKDLGNAIALNSSLFNGARLVGPSIAGVLIAVTNEGVCFLINALSFVFVLASLFAMRLEKRERSASKESFMKVITEGFSYSFGMAPVRGIILLLAVLSIVGMPYIVLLPVITSDILHAGSRTYGFLMGAVGLGALTGALYLASRIGTKGLWRTIAISASAFGTGVVLLSLTGNVILSLLVLFVVGLSMIITTAASNTMLQTIAEEDKRARVMGFYSMALLGAFPVGSLIAGTMADLVGVRTTLAIGGTISIIAALFFSWRLPYLMKGYRSGKGKL